MTDNNSIPADAPLNAKGREIFGHPKPQKPERGTREAQRYMGDVADLPCQACGMGAPSLVHHWIHGRGSQTKTSDLETIALCYRCHMLIHKGPVAWLNAGMEAEQVLVKKTRAAVEAVRANRIGGRD